MTCEQVSLVGGLLLFLKKTHAKAPRRKEINKELSHLSALA